MTDEQRDYLAEKRAGETKKEGPPEPPETLLEGELDSLRADLATALTERNQALAAQAELMQQLADIHDLAVRPSMPAPVPEERLAAIAKRTRTHHTPV